MADLSQHPADHFVLNEPTVDSGDVETWEYMIVAFGRSADGYAICGTEGIDKLADYSSSQCLSEWRNWPEYHGWRDSPLLLVWAGVLVQDDDGKYYDFDGAWRLLNEREKQFVTAATPRGFLISREEAKQLWENVNG